MSPWKHVPRGLWGRVTSETPKPSTTLGNAAHQPCSPQVGERRLKPFEGFPQMPKEQISLISFCPKEICSPSTQTFGKKKEKSPRCAGCKNLIWGHCCWLGASPQPLAMQCQVPVRKGFFPSRPHQAQGKEKAAGCSSRCLWDALTPAAARGVVSLGSGSSPHAPRQTLGRPHAFRMIRPGFLQSRYRSLRTEWTSGLEKLEWFSLVALLVRRKVRQRQRCGSEPGTCPLHLCPDLRDQGVAAAGVCTEIPCRKGGMGVISGAGE